MANQGNRSERTIETRYTFRKETVKVNKSAYAERAVLACIKHMRANDYSASVAEVVDTLSGVLHAVVTLDAAGNMKIVFKREYRSDEA
jgi:hypothetical protein